MNIDAILSKINEIEASISEIKEELDRELKPYRLAFVNFFAGGKSYAYSVSDEMNIAEGDIVYVPTSSRGNIAGVVVYTERYKEAELPFHNTKAIINKLQSVDTLTADDIVRMTSELAPAIADKEASKGRLIAFLARRAVSASAPASVSSSDNIAEEDMHCSCNGNTTEPDAITASAVTPIDDDAWDEGDIETTIGANEPETTLTDSSNTGLPF